MLLVAVTKHPAEINVREKRMRAWSATMGKAGPQERLLIVSAGAHGSCPADQEVDRVRTAESGRKPQGSPHPRDPVHLARLHS